MLNRMILAVTCLFAISSAHASLELSPSTRNKIDVLLNKTNKSFPGFGLGIVALDGGRAKVLYEGSSGIRGYDEKGKPLPVETKSLFRMVSISKSVTSISLTSLMKNRGFNWKSLLWDQTSDFINYLKQLDSKGSLVNSKSWKSVELSELANHTSGTPHFYMSEDLVRKEGRAEQDSYFDTSLALGYDFFPTPSGKFVYANEDFNVLARIVGGLGGMSGADDSDKFQNFVLSSVLRPMATKGQVGYNFPRDKSEFSTKVARGFESLTNVSPILYEPNHFSGCCGVSMSIDGLSIYAGELLQLADGQSSSLPINPSDFYDLIAPDHIFDVGLGKMIYGKGFYWQNYGGVLSFNHLGIDRYYTAEISVYPIDGFAIVSATNIGNVVSELRDLGLEVKKLVSDDLKIRRTYQMKPELEAIADKANGMF